MKTDVATLGRRIDVAAGREPADLAIRGVRLFNLADGSVETTDIAIAGDTIVGVGEGYRGVDEIDGTGRVAVPGFIDTHLHVESSLVTPPEFDRCVLPRGTTTAICDPHEIANVLGRQGIEYFLESAGHTVLDLRVQLSSCVPATAMETSGAELDADDLVAYRHHPAVIGLAEFMSFPGVLAKDPGALAKLAAFSDGRIDGHAPLVTGRDLNAYLAAGVRNDHEATRLEEGREKIARGMHVLIREGSVSRDLTALAPLIAPDTIQSVALCTDDRNPLDIAEDGHIDHLIRKAIRLGARPLDAYRAASWSAARGFGLDDRGLIAPGRLADIVLLDDLEAVAVTEVIKAGRPVTAERFAARTIPPVVGRGSVKLDPVDPSVFAVPASGPTGPVIGVVDGSIITRHLSETLPFSDGHRHPDPARDILKVCVFARHGRNRNVGRGFVTGFGLRDGALASSVGHDAHNACVVGVEDRDMAVAVNRLIEIEGGFVAVRDGRVIGELPLPIAGLMSDRSFEEVEAALRPLRAAVAGLGCPLAEPFLQLAFLPLPVIPHLKITDHGLVDVDKFELIAA